jgi:hypothetical protein
VSLRLLCFCVKKTKEHLLLAGAIFILLERLADKFGRLWAGAG